MQDVERPVVRDCLVAVATNDADLELFRRAGLYRIPERVLGRSLAREALAETRAIALYQSSSVQGGLAGSIEHWGSVISVERLRRREILPGEADHPAADEYYHLLRSGHIEHLSHPIVSHHHRRFAFLRTTLDRLLVAEELNDLVVASPQEETLWRELRRCDLEVERRYFIRSHGVVMEVDFALFGSRGPVGVLCCERPRISTLVDEVDEAWRIVRFSPVEVEQDPSGCIARLSEILSGREDPLVPMPRADRRAGSEATGGA